MGFRIVEIEADEISTSGLGQDLLNEEVTGILIKNFISNSERISILLGLESMPKSDKTSINDGFESFPLSFAQFAQQKQSGKMTDSDYNRVATSFKDSFKSNFGFDYEMRLKQAFGSLLDGEVISARGESQMVPFTFRELAPKKGELIAHCENLFFDEFPAFFDWFKQVGIKSNKFSFFLTVQASESGGELCCFDLRWPEVNHRISPTVLQKVDGSEIDISDLSEVQRNFIKPGNGDLLLFNGGSQWHRVELIQGNKSRITLGGFVATTNTNDEYLLWS